MDKHSQLQTQCHELDINLPVFDGYYICREIRSTSNVPIIIVTSRDSEIDEFQCDRQLIEVAGQWVVKAIENKAK